MDLGLDGRVALVMGSSQGIGLGIASALAREGARVALAARSEDALARAAGEIAGDARSFVADTLDLDRLAALPGEVERELGAVEILVTNTGGPSPGGALEGSREEWELAHRSLVLAPRTLIDAVAPGMRERGWGRIINVGSSSVREPIEGLALSNAERMGAVGLFKTLSAELAGDGITINTVATGLFETERLAALHGSMEAARRHGREQVPAGRLGTPEEYGDLVAFLASERAGYLTGAVIPLDGGRLRGV